MTINFAPCFCCSDRPFNLCCEPILQDHAKATVPEVLMRSRYTAYVLKNETYLLATWAPSTRPGALLLEESTTKWLGLEIIASTEVVPESDTGEVEFKARFIEGDQLYTMHEKSRFIRHSGLWYYLDGTCEIDKQKVARNGHCPCGSGKKFKRCCLQITS
ncbi:YchJ family protein [Desulfosediminicola ganghwensis]|uniref:YchJ family protein n=1 Tax=Desulfosediminicola ganghwensis TaxID=2569540 RepID=UPI0010AD760C|nr:YchJ family metal-binding protein [Desulfosediminicola ganghwensis]